MSPQKAEFNRKVWSKLETKVRALNDREDVLETYVLNCPVFDFTKPIELIGDRQDRYGIQIPVPHAFVKSVLAEFRNGQLKLWTFLLENRELSDPLESHLVVTYDAERLVGGQFWDRITERDLHGMKETPIKMW